MRNFDYLFLGNGLLPANLVNLTANISALKTMDAPVTMVWAYKKEQRLYSCGAIGIGSLQVMEAVKYIVGVGELPDPLPDGSRSAGPQLLPRRK